MPDFAEVEEAEDAIRKYANYPSVGATIRMCRLLGIHQDNLRTIKEDSAWEYFYELLSELSDTITREQLYKSFADYFSPGKIEEHLNNITHHRRRTA